MSANPISAPSPGPHTVLPRRLGLLNAISINMSNMVGTGPFITVPAIIATLGGPQSLIAWAVGALLAIADGLVKTPVLVGRKDDRSDVRLVPGRVQRPDEDPTAGQGQEDLVGSMTRAGPGPRGQQYQSCARRRPGSGHDIERRT